MRQYTGILLIRLLFIAAIEKKKNEKREFIRLNF